MKTHKWILGTIQVLCFFVFVGVLGTCNLQNEPPKPFYRLMAYHSSGAMSTEAGFYFIDARNLYPVSSWGGNHSGEGWWQAEIPEEQVELQHCYQQDLNGLYVHAAYQPAIGTLITKIIHVDEKGNERVIDEDTPNGWTPPYDMSTCISYAHLWDSASPPPPPPPTKLICAELHRQGLMDETIFEADEAFGRYLRDNHRDVLLGYQLWAKPVVKWMQKSKIVTRIVASVATPWSYEMSYRMGARDRGTFAGKLLMDVGVPTCRTVGRAMIWAGARSP